MPAQTESPQLRVVIFGATGTVGAGVLLECLDSPAIAGVLCVVRRSMGRSHPKLREIVHGDFTNFDSIAAELEGIDACFWCIGIPSAGLSEERYSEVTHDYTVAAARVLLQQSPQARFVFVSGEGADESEKGRSMWARVKGRTENAILAMGFADAVVFRPGMIAPRRGLRHNVRLYRVVTAMMWPAMPLLRVLGMATSTVELGRAMIAVALGEKAAGEQVGEPKKCLGCADINELAKRAPA